MNSDYDVFLSFSSSDIEIARHIWEEFTKNGVRAFISDETLKSRIGQSFITAIQHALEKSDNFVLLATPSSLESAWVREEYETFYVQKYIPSDRSNRLFILKTSDIELPKLPFMLRNIQISESVDSILNTIGKFSALKLREENLRLRKKIKKLESENYRLNELILTNKNIGNDVQTESGFNDNADKVESAQPNIYVDTSKRSQITQQQLDFVVEMTVSKNEASHGFFTIIELPTKIACNTCGGKDYKRNGNACKTCGGKGQVRVQHGYFSVVNTCPACRGTGKSSNCPKCDGSGTIESSRKVKLTVPPIEGDKLKLRVKDEGNSSPSEEEKGDVFVLISVESNT